MWASGDKPPIACYEDQFESVMRLVPKDRLIALGPKGNQPVFASWIAECDRA